MKNIFTTISLSITLLCTPNLVDDALFERLPIKSKQIDDIEFFIQKYSKQHKVDPKLVKEVIQTESSWRPHVISNKGAVGLMQITPITAKHLKINPHNLEENIEGGIRYLAEQIKRFKKIHLALAAYNAGPGNVNKYGRVPPFKETERYVSKICENYSCG